MDIQKIRSYHSQISCMYNLVMILSALGIMLNYFGRNNLYMYLTFGGILTFSVIYLRPLQIMHCLSEGYTSTRGLQEIDKLLSEGGKSHVKSNSNMGNMYARLSDN